MTTLALAVSKSKPLFSVKNISFGLRDDIVRYSNMLAKIMMIKRWWQKLHTFGYCMLMVHLLDDRYSNCKGDNG